MPERPQKSELLRTLLSHLHACAALLAVIAVVYISFLVFCYHTDRVIGPGLDRSLLLSLCSENVAEVAEDFVITDFDGDGSYANAHCIFIIDLYGSTDRSGLLAPTHARYRLTLSAERRWLISPDGKVLSWLPTKAEEQRIGRYLVNTYSSRGVWKYFFHVSNPDPLNSAVVGEVAVRGVVNERVLWSGYVMNFILFLATAMVISFILRPMFTSRRQLDKQSIETA